MSGDVRPIERYTALVLKPGIVGAKVRGIFKRPAQ